MSFKDLPIMPDKKRVFYYSILMSQKNQPTILKKNYLVDG